MVNMAIDEDIRKAKALDRAERRSQAQTQQAEEKHREEMIESLSKKRSPTPDPASPKKPGEDHSFQPSHQQARQPDRSTRSRSIPSQYLSQQSPSSQSSWQSESGEKKTDPDILAPADPGTRKSRQERFHEYSGDIPKKASQFDETKKRQELRKLHTGD